MRTKWIGPLAALTSCALSILASRAADTPGGYNQRQLDDRRRDSERLQQQIDLNRQLRMGAEKTKIPSYHNDSAPVSGEKYLEWATSMEEEVKTGGEWKGAFGSERSWEKAYDLYKEAGNRGSAEGDLNAGRLIEERKVTYTLESCIEHYSAAAGRGLPEGYYRLGLATVGMAKEENDEDCLKGRGWVAMSGEKGYKPETIHLLNYDDGYEKAARKLSEEKAEEGFGYFQYKLAWDYENGWGGRRDIGLAASWYRKAIEQGVRPARMRLAVLQFEGRLGTNQIAEGRQRLEKMAKDGNEKASDLLEAVKRKAERQAEWAAQRAKEREEMLKRGEEGEVHTCLELAAESGTNLTAAAHWYRRICDYREGILGLYGLYEKNPGHTEQGEKLLKEAQAAEQKQDFQGATKNYQAATELGNTNAMAKLADWHRQGKGVPKDAKAAEKYQNDIKAEQIVAEYAHNKKAYLSDPPPKVTPEVVEQWKYYAGDDFEDVQAQYYLAQAYENGQGGLTASGAMAMLWYKVAAAQGHAKAKEWLAEEARRMKLALPAEEDGEPVATKPETSPKAQATKPATKAQTTLKAEPKDIKEAAQGLLDKLGAKQN